MREDESASVRLLELLAPVHDRARLTARRLCRSDSDGDDLFQDAVLRAFERLPELRDDAAFGAWFYRILLSLQRTRMRRPLWRRWVPIEDVPEVASGEGAGWTSAAASAQRARAALSTLPAVQREAVVLFELDGYTIDEIAGMQGVTGSAVKTRLARGRDRLRRHYERLERRQKREEAGLLAAAPGRRNEP